MGTRETTQGDTRDRVLRSAIDVFAEKGYSDATVHEICEGAGANIAAVNYYFGSKEELYAEAWRQARSDALAAHPPDGGVAADAPAIERFRGWVRAHIQRMADENHKEFLIMHKELANPTGLLDEIRREEVEPQRKQTLALIAELVGPSVPERDLFFCEASVLSQCMSVIHRHRLRGKSRRALGPTHIQDTDAYASHVVAFSLGGMEAIRNAAQADAEGGAHDTSC
jgi:AcrR family transcriptional regulator